MKIDEHLVKISAGQVVIDGELEQDQEVALMIKGNVTKVEYKSNQDGTSNRIITVKGYLANIVYKDEHGVVTQELDI